MKALVTGGCGFIGSHLVGHLLAKGHEVTVIDNFASGSLKNLEFCISNPRLAVIEADITDIDLIFKEFKGVDWVFHLAGLADIVPSIESPNEYFAVNVGGTLNVLQASLKNDVKKFVYAASSSCYGLPTEFPTPETAQINPQYPYALTKYMGEELVLHWTKVYGLDAISLRLFNVYGPRSRTSGAYGAVFGVFLAQKLHGKPFTVVGDGEQTRDFTYVTDVVAAFYAAIESNISGEVLNVGSGCHQSINYLISLLGGAVERLPKRPGEPDCTFADISKICSKLAWRPIVSFEEGVNQMLSCIGSWSDAPVWNSDSILKATKSWFKYLK